MSRRVSLTGLILVVLIWIGVLLTPQLRVLLDSQRKPSDERVNQWMPNPVRYSDESLAQLLREHRNDPRILAVQIENSKLAGLESEHRKLQLREYDALIERFPDELWLIQNRLRLSTMGGLVPLAGEFTSVMTRSRTWLTREENLQALSMAERGAKLDPPNSFYDWMRATFLFILERPDEALRALAAGARKSRFDDGVLRDTQIRIEVREMEHPLLWEARVETMVATVLPHYVVFRNTNNAALWRGTVAERNGSHQRALEIYANQIRLLETMRRDINLELGLNFSESLLQRTWAGLERKDKSRSMENPPKTMLQRTREIARAFANYAQQHGRPDLAQNTLRQARDFDWYDLRNFLQSTAPFGAVDKRIMQRIGQYFWIGKVVFHTTLILVSLWLVLSAISLFTPGARVLLPPLDVVANVLFTVATLAVVIFVALRIGVNQPILMDLFPLADAGRTRLRMIIPILEKILMGLPLLTTIFYCGAATLWQSRKKPRASLTQDTPPHERSAMDQVKSGLRWGGRLLGGLVLCYLTMAWAFMLLNLSSVENSEIYVLIPAPLVVAALVIHLWRRRGMYFHNWPYLLAWCRSTLGMLVVVGSVAYLCTSLLALPLRREADARLDDVIARGEVAVQRDLAGKRER